MLVECQHCGAPLDVRPGAETSKCRYCGTTTKISSTRTIAPQTPSDWRPPPRWRPPAHMPADSDVELHDKGGGGGGGLVAVIAILVGVAVVIAVVVSKSGGIGGVAPEAFDAVTFKETATEMKQKLGGSLSGKSLRVDLKGPFSYAVISWDDKDRSHPSSMSVFTGTKTCTSQLQAMRAKLQEDLGSRFNGTAWYWGQMYLSFDANCSSISLYGHGMGENEDWKPVIEATWKLVRSDVFGRPARPSPEEFLGFLGRGYPAADVAAVVAGTTIDDGPAAVRKKLPGSVLHLFIDMEAKIPLAHPTFRTVEARWPNKKSGSLSSLRVDALPNKLGDHLGVARCLGKEMNAPVEINETDYVKKTSDASLKIPGVTAHISADGVYFSSSFSSGGLTPALVTALLLAIDRCP
jgi:LSD1 subclass zinc finger protein